MVGLVPRLSGSAYGEFQLIWRCRGAMSGWYDKVIDRYELHQVGPDEAREGEEARHGGLQGVGHAQQEVGDESDGDLDADGVLAGAQELADLQRLFDPAEEQ